MIKNRTICRRVIVSGIADRRERQSARFSDFMLLVLLLLLFMCEKNKHELCIKLSVSVTTVRSMLRAVYALCTRVRPHGPAHYTTSIILCRQNKRTTKRRCAPRTLRALLGQLRLMRRQTKQMEQKVSDLESQGLLVRRPIRTDTSKKTDDNIFRELQHVFSVRQLLAKDIEKLRHDIANDMKSRELEKENEISDVEMFFLVVVGGTIFSLVILAVGDFWLSVCVEPTHGFQYEELEYD